jgi:DNA polymerase-3 subunit delta'
VAIIPLYGHEPLRARLGESAAAGTLPHSMLLVGPRGVGKQRLALWIGQMLLCSAEKGRPCGKCQHCRYSEALVHPDLHWFFPRPRLKDTDPDPDTIREDNRDAIAERVERRGLYAPADGTENIYIAVVRALLQQAVLSPALAKRKVFVVGDAERMVSQEGSEQAANAFLKLLEEPSAGTTLILTSSEPGALLPTVRSRVVTVRVPALPERSVRQFLADPAVSEALADAGLPRSTDEQVRLANGAPGALVAATGLRDATEQARRLLDAAARGDAADRFRIAFTQGSSKARGAFMQTLEALTILLHERVRTAVADEDPNAASIARGLEAVERAKAMATSNVNPQLLSAALLRHLEPLVR